MTDSIKPKLVLVTGANRGIGREVLRQLAEGGGARDFVKGVEAAGVIGRGVEAIALDVASPATPGSAAWTSSSTIPGRLFGKLKKKYGFASDNLVTDDL